MLIRPDIYDELLGARKRIRLLEEQNATLRGELRAEQDARNKAVGAAGVAHLRPSMDYLSMRCALDPVVLRHAHNTREAFNHILSRWFEELWAAYRSTELPPRSYTDEADPSLR